MGTHDQPESTADVIPMLALARRSALQLLEGFPEPPSALRVTLPDVHVEATWPPARRPHDDVDDVPPATVAPADVVDVTHVVRAPTVGLFVVAPDATSGPFVAVGDGVAAGQQLGTVTLLGLPLAVRASGAGVVVDVLRKDGDPVEHDEPLFVIAPHRPA